MNLPARSPLFIAALCAAQTLAAQSPATAPSAPPVQLEAIRVTGDLWESPLARIPASVSVYDESALRDRNVRHFSDLVDQIPNLTWTGGTSRPRYFQIRGIGENSQFEGETPDSTVRFLVDDLDFTGLGTLGSTFDVRQVEVLRGPQAGAFGANAAGGVVRLVTNAPTPFWTGELQGSVGEDRLRSAGVAVGGPLLAHTPDKLMARLAVQQHESRGFRRNVTLNRDANARDELTARLRLTLNATPQWRWDAALLYSDVDNGYDEFALDNNGYHTFSDQPGRDRQRSRAGSIRGTYTGFGAARLTLVTGASDVDSVYSYDDDWTAASYMGFSDLRRERSVVSQEVRLDSTATQAAAGWVDRWTWGAYFARTDEASAYTNEDPWTLRGLRTNYDARHSALFGQIAHDLAAGTRLIVGLRAEHLELAGDGITSRLDKTTGIPRTPVSFQPRFDDTIFGGKLTLEHDLSDRHLGFVSVTRGYKAGGVNIDARINPPSDPLTYATEYLWNYEVGVRGHWFEQRVTGEMTAFYLDRRDTQVRDSAGFGGNYRFFTANADRSHVYGLEAASSFAVTKAFSLHGSLALMESELEAFTLGNGNTGGGRTLANTPPYGYTVGARYRGDSGWFGHTELIGRGRQYDSNNQHEAREPFNVVNASIGYAWRDWTFTLWARNLLDERYEKRVYFFGNEDPDYTPTRYENRADARQIGLTASYRF